MVVDTSALLAILRDEPPRAVLAEALATAEDAILSAASFVEASIVLLARHGDAGVAALDSLLAAVEARCVAVDVAQARAARDAYARYGKGRAPAGLNFGDCFAYALAKVSNRPLLYVGDDFARTDVASVL